MTNEIKELLDDIKRLIEEDETPENMKKYVGGTFNIIELKLLLDYITNLQDKLKWYENIDPNKTIDKFRLEQNMKVKNLHQRIDRAVEYITIFKDDIRGLDEIVLLDILRGDE